MLRLKFGPIWVVEDSLGRYELHSRVFLKKYFIFVESAVMNYFFTYGAYNYFEEILGRAEDVVYRFVPDYRGKYGSNDYMDAFYSSILHYMLSEDFDTLVRVFALLDTISIYREEISKMSREELSMIEQSLNRTYDVDELLSYSNEAMDTIGGIFPEKNLYFTVDAIARYAGLIAVSDSGDEIRISPDATAMNKLMGLIKRGELSGAVDVVLPTSYLIYRANIDVVRSGEIRLPQSARMMDFREGACLDLLRANTVYVDINTLLSLYSTDLATLEELSFLLRNCMVEESGIDPPYMLFYGRNRDIARIALTQFLVDPGEAMEFLMERIEFLDKHPPPTNP